MCLQQPSYGSNLCLSLDERIKKMLHTCTTEYYSGIKKEGNLAISDNILDPWMDLEGILLIEMSEKDNYYMISLIHEI